ncbi:MAG: hypothetical protein WD649_04495 [Thermoleophilaceae bacterium]
MSLDGLRAWVAEVERKLGKRTRVFLALSAIAIGIAGASVYLAIDTRQSSVSESDVQELQAELEARIDALEAGGAVAPTPAPTPEPGGAEEDGGTGSGGLGSGGSNGGGAADDTGGTAEGDADADNPGQLKDLLEQSRDAQK